MLASLVGGQIILHRGGHVVVARYYHCAQTSDELAAAHIRATINGSLEFPASEPAHQVPPRLLFRIASRQNEKIFKWARGIVKKFINCIIDSTTQPSGMTQADAMQKTGPERIRGLQP
jgi:hypothetical protein